MTTTTWIDAVTGEDMTSDMNEQIHEVSEGRWVIARWHEPQAQWQTSVSREETGGFHLAFARSLETLAKLAGVHVYRTRDAAASALAERRGYVRAEA